MLSPIGAQGLVHTCREVVCRFATRSTQQRGCERNQGCLSESSRAKSRRRPVQLHVARHMVLFVQVMNQSDKVTRCDSVVKLNTDIAQMPAVTYIRTYIHTTWMKLPPAACNSNMHTSYIHTYLCVCVVVVSASCISLDWLVLQLSSGTACGRARSWAADKPPRWFSSRRRGSHRVSLHVECCCCRCSNPRSRNPTPKPRPHTHTTHNCIVTQMLPGRICHGRLAQCVGEKVRGD